MSTERRIEDLVVAALLETAPRAVPPALIADVMRDARRTRRRPSWLALITEPPMGRSPSVLVGSPTARTASVFLAVALAVLLGAVALVAGGWISRRDATVVPVRQTDAPPADASVDAAPSPTAKSLGSVVYSIEHLREVGQGGCQAQNVYSCLDITHWISRTDGSGVQTLAVDNPRSGMWLGWSPDGSRMVFLHGDQTATNFELIDELGGVEFRFSVSKACPTAGFCSPEATYALSPDETHIAMAWSSEDLAKASGTSGISIIDLETGTITEVPGTRSQNHSDHCQRSTRCEGEAHRPRWSPDGQRLVFDRESMSAEPGTPWTSAAIYSVGIDGSDLRRLTPQGIYATDARWSPDGSMIAFTGLTTSYDQADDSVVTDRPDIYVMGADGTALHRLTDDAKSYAPTWTADGRLTFTRGGDGPTQAHNWIMNADGSEQAELGFDLPTLSAAGCSVCLYPGPDLTRSVTPATWLPRP
jgi:WD40-like Beta Propeller Repeat